MKRYYFTMMCIVGLPSLAISQIDSMNSPTNNLGREIVARQANNTTPRVTSVISMPESLPGIYKFTKTLDILVTPQKNDSGESVDLKAGYLIDVLYKKDGDVYFKYLNFSKNATLKAKYNGNSNEKVFRVPEEVFQYITKKKYKIFKGFNVGAYTIPFRLRGLSSGNFDFEQSLSLSTNLIAGWGSRYKQESWLDAALGIGITGVSLNSKNTQNRVTENRTATAFTVSFGAVLIPKSNVNIGVFGGWDLLSNQDRNDVNWIHNGKFWLGLGINVSFNILKTEVQSTSGTNPDK